MGGKQMEGSPEQRRQKAKEARREGKKPSEEGATLGASKQHKDAKGDQSHEERLAQKREGKRDSLHDANNETDARPHSRDPRR